MKTIVFRTAATALAFALCAPITTTAQEVNLYTTREPGLIQPLLDAFTKDSGIQVRSIFIKDGLLERVRAEGERSPADVLMTVDIGNLLDLTDADLTQPVDSPALEQAIPANLRDRNGHWFAFSLRDRVLYAHKDLPITHFNYEELAEPEWKGRVCIRSGQHPYNTALIAAKIAHDGVQATQTWLEGVKQNLARKAAGGDRNVARDILGGICDIGIANAYYVGRMKTSEPGSEARAWGDAIKVVRPQFSSSADGGTHVNISGASLARHAPNRDNAIRFMEYLISPEAQAIYANANFEYPVRAGVEVAPVMAALGPLKVDSLDMTEIARHRKQASELVDRVGFDH